MDMNVLSGGIVGTLALTGGFWAAGKFGPGLVVRKLHQGFDLLKDSDWVRNPSKLRRARWLLATVELLEDEIPEKGDGQAAYDALGSSLSSYAHVGSPAQWAKVLRQFGDAVDTELDDDIKTLAAPLPAAATDAAQAGSDVPHS